MIIEVDDITELKMQKITKDSQQNLLHYTGALNYDMILPDICIDINTIIVYNELFFKCKRPFYKSNWITDRKYCEQLEIIDKIL